MICINNLTTSGIVALLLSFSAYSQSIKKPSWSGTSEAPKNISWRTVIPSKEESGEKLIVSGTILVTLDFTEIYYFPQPMVRFCGLFPVSFLLIPPA